jgi:hypothetical protein
VVGLCYVTVDDNGEIIETITTSAPRRGPGRQYHAPRTINVRQGPGTGHAVAYALDPGDLTYIGQSNADGWAAVYGGPGSADTVGFVYAELLRSGPAPDLLLVEYDWEPGGRWENPKIVGSVKNTTGRTYSYIQISWNLYDAQDRQVGTAWTNTTNLRAGEFWRFEALVAEDNARKYRLAELEGY